MHTFIDPKGNVRRSSHLLRDCRTFVDMQKYYAALHAQSNPMMQGAPAATAPNLPPPPPQPQQQLQVQQRGPPEAFPPPRGQMNKIQKTCSSKRELKKFTWEVNLTEAAMTTEYVD